MNSIWESIVTSWISCLKIPGIRQKNVFNEVTISDLDIVSKYILKKEEEKEAKTEINLGLGETWISHFLSEKFPALKIFFLPQPNPDDVIVGAISLILYSSLYLKDEYIMKRMCLMDDELQVTLKSLFNHFLGSNLSLITLSHILEVLSMISCDSSKSDATSFSSPLAYSSCLSFSTPTQKSRELSEKHAEVAKLIQTINQCESEKDDLNRALEALKIDLAAKEREVNQKNIIINSLRCSMEELENNTNNTYNESSMLFLKEKHAKQVEKLTLSLEDEQCKVLSLQSCLDELKKKLRNEEQLNQKKVLELKDHCENLEQVNAEYKIKITLLEETIQKMIKEKEELDAAVNQLKESSFQSFKTEDLSFNSSSHNIGNFLLMEAEKRVKDFEEISQQKDVEISSLNEKLNTLQAALSTSENELKVKQDLLSVEVEKRKEYEVKFRDIQMREKESLEKCALVVRARFSEELKAREKVLKASIDELKQKVSKLEADNKKWSQKARLTSTELSQLKQLHENCKLRLRTTRKENGGSAGKGNLYKTPPSSKVKQQTPRKGLSDKQETAVPITPNKKSVSVTDVEEFSEHHRQALLVQHTGDLTDDPNRLSELIARNAKLPPNLQTCYPGETQMATSDFSEAEFKVWSSRESLVSRGLRKRNNNDLFRPSDAFFIPVTGRRSVSCDNIPKTTKNS